MHGLRHSASAPNYLCIVPIIIKSCRYLLSVLSIRRSLIVHLLQDTYGRRVS